MTSEGALSNFRAVGQSVFLYESHMYRITGIFCGCLIFAEFCSSIEFAEIKNRKIFHSRYNDEIMSEDTVQLRIFRCLSGIVV